MRRFFLLACIGVSQKSGPLKQNMSHTIHVWYVNTYIYHTNQCMEYLPTFCWFVCYMYIYIYHAWMVGVIDKRELLMISVQCRLLPWCFWDVQTCKLQGGEFIMFIFLPEIGRLMEPEKASWIPLMTCVPKIHPIRSKMVKIFRRDPQKKTTRLQ